MRRKPYRFGSNIGRMQIQTSAPLRFSGSPIDMAGLRGGNLPFDLGTPVGQNSGGLSSPGKNTVQVDGGADFLNMFSGFATAALQNLGAQPEPTAATVQPAAYVSAGTGGFDPKLLWVIGAAGVLAFVAFKK